MFERLFLMLHAWCLGLRGAELAAGARVNLSTRFSHVKGLWMGAHSRLYWGGDVLLGPRGRLQVGSNSHLAPYFYCLVANNTLALGDNVAVGPHCLFFCHSNDIPSAVDSELFINCHVDGDICIGSNVLIGARVTILPGTRIGDNVVVAAGSVVKGELDAGWLYAGVPARKVKPLC